VWCGAAKSVRHSLPAKGVAHGSAAETQLVDLAAVMLPQPLLISTPCQPCDSQSGLAGSAVKATICGSGHSVHRRCR
jgi:hypothetical protein